MRAVLAPLTASPLLAAAALLGCGSAAPAAQSPADVAVVNVGGGGHMNARTKRADADPTAKKENDRAAVVAKVKDGDDPAEYGIIGLLNSDAATTDIFSGVAGGVPGGVSGGVVGGVIGVGSGGGSGFGGLGLSGIGTNVGSGAGIGLGSIGTGGGGYGFSSLGSGNPVAGQAVHVSGNTVIELGDSVSLGVSIEASTRMLRDRVTVLRSCYEKGLEKNRALAGTIEMRLVVGSEGRIKVSREIGSSIADRAMVACVLKAMDSAFVGLPGGVMFGVVETAVRFSTKKP